MNPLIGKKYGIFNHYLYFNLCPNGGYKEWNDCINSIDVKKMAKTIYDTGAEYYFITLMQGEKYMISPNEVYDTFCFEEAGKLTPNKDIIMELALELKKYNIDMYLYFTGDGPHTDKRIGSNIGFVTDQPSVTEEFVKNWSSVLECYSKKYKDLIKGYWIDGCYHWWGNTDELLHYYYNAVKAGNKDAVVAINDGLDFSFKKYYSKQDFTAGEVGDFTEYPPSQFVDIDCLCHVLVPLGLGTCEENPNGWYSTGCKRTKEEVLAYVKKVNEIGCPVTIDIHINADGTYDEDQVEVLKYLKNNL